MEHERIKLWDLPVRIFHWLLVLLVIAAVISGKVGGDAMDWHARIGIAILGLIVFRLIWGFIGPTYARFTHFVRGPAAIADYLHGRWQGIGHNPLGALSVVALLVMIALQVATGLFSNDDIVFNGPLSQLVDKALSDRLTGFHKLSINILIALIALHIVAIAFYAAVRKEDLIRPMITGWKAVPRRQEPPSKGGGRAALIVAIAIAAGAMYAGSGAWLRHDSPLPAVAKAANGG